MRQLIKSCLIFVFASLLSCAASAVPVDIDRTRRTIDAPAECQNNAQGFNDIGFNRGGIALQASAM